MKEKLKKGVHERKKEISFQVREYNGCCAGLHNIKKSKALNIHFVYS
jgi:hypothetical protein